jgi:hypothetical protein
MPLPLMFNERIDRNVYLLSFKGRNTLVQEILYMVLKTSCIPLLEISEALHQSIEIDRVWTIKIKLVRVCFGMLLRSQAFVERVLHPILSISEIHES